MTTLLQYQTQKDQRNSLLGLGYNVQSSSKPEVKRSAGPEQAARLRNGHPLLDLRGVDPGTDVNPPTNTNERTQEKTLQHQLAPAPRPSPSSAPTLKLEIPKQ